jgi:hypothetical protein
MKASYEENRKKLAEKVKTELPKLPIQEVKPVEVKEEKEAESHVNFWLPSSIMEDIKILSIKQKKTIKEIGREAFVDIIAKYKL